MSEGADSTTIQSILTDACDTLGIPLGTTTFLNDDFVVESADCDNYDMAISGTTITYTMEAPYEPSTDEIIGELTDMIIELDERVSALEEG